MRDFTKVLKKWRKNELPAILTELENRTISFDVVLFGTYSGGKSAFINMLLDLSREESLPSRAQPETKCLWKIRDYDKIKDVDLAEDIKKNKNVVFLKNEEHLLSHKCTIQDLAINNRDETLDKLLSEVTEIEFIREIKLIRNRNRNNPIYIWDVPGTGDFDGELRSINARNRERVAINKAIQSNLCIIVGPLSKIKRNSEIEIYKQLRRTNLIVIIRPEDFDEDSKIWSDYSENELNDFSLVPHKKSIDEINKKLAADCISVEDFLKNKCGIEKLDIFPVQIKNEIKYSNYLKLCSEKSIAPCKFKRSLFGGSSVRNYIARELKFSDELIAIDVCRLKLEILEEIKEDVILSYDRKLKEEEKVLISLCESISKQVWSFSEFKYKQKRDTLTKIISRKVKDLEKTSYFRRNWFWGYYVVDKLQEYMEDASEIRNFFAYELDNIREILRELIDSSDLSCEIQQLILKKFDDKYRNLPILQFDLNKFIEKCNKEYTREKQDWITKAVRYVLQEKLKYTETLFKERKAFLLDSIQNIEYIKIARIKKDKKSDLNEINNLIEGLKKDVGKHEGKIKR